jgi:hypothetical protein
VLLFFGHVAESLFYHEVFDAFARERVRFVVVGGVAVNLRGVPRFTADLDVAVALELDNLRAIEQALTALGLRPRLPESVEKLADPETRRDWTENRNLKAFTFQHPSNPLCQVDLVIAPFSYEDIDADAETLHAEGLSLRVASAATLIRMKTGTGRDQDASDVDALKRIAELGDE